MYSFTLRSLAAGSAVALGSGFLVLAGTPSATAAWSTQTSVHNAKLQACKVKGKAVVKFRLKNRKGDHAHRGGFQVSRRASKFVEVRAKAGKVSKVKKVTARKKDTFSTMVGEINGPSAGGGGSVAELKFC